VIKKNVPEKRKEITNKTNVKSVGNSEKYEKVKKNDKGISPGMVENKKKEQEKGIGGDVTNNNNQTFLKRKRETSGQNIPNKKSVKTNNSAKKK